ncbi:MAG: Kelch repeat-containing protein [Nitrososphaeraceae archaeon]
MSFQRSLKFLFSIFLFSAIFITLVLNSYFVDAQPIETQNLFWINGSSMEIPRTEVSATMLDNKIYVIGGFDKFGNVVDTVERYDINSDSWTTVSPLPLPLHHTASATFNGSIYVIGGYTNNWIPTNNLFVFDPEQNLWIEETAMPTERGALNAEFINGTLYAIGGEGNGVIMGTNESYDPITQSWSIKSPMPTPRNHAASAVIDGSIYVIGGRVDGTSPITNVNNNEMYEPSTNTWVELKNMPSKRSGISASAIIDQDKDIYDIYVFGGEDIRQTYDYTERFNITDGNWTIEESMPTARHGLASVSFENKIYVIGGGVKPGLSVSNLNEILYINHSK